MSKLLKWLIIMIATSTLPLAAFRWRTSIFKCRNFHLDMVDLDPSNGTLASLQKDKLYKMKSWDTIEFCVLHLEVFIRYV